MEIKKFTPTSHKVKALVYGASGSGKTTFAGTAKNALFLSAEGGLLSISERGVSFVEIGSLKDLTDSLEYLKKNPTEFDTVVIDSISEINDIIVGEIEKRIGKSMQLQNWGELAQKMRNILREFRDLPMHVIFIALEKNVTDDTKIQKIVPEISGKAATGIAAFMDIVGYITVEKDGTRSILTNSQNLLLTKDRSNVIGDNTEPDFQVWIKKISGIKIGKQDILYTDEISHEQIDAINSLWDELSGISGMSKEESPARFAQTLNSKYGKISVEALSNEQATECISSLSDAISKKKEEINKGKKDEEKAKKKESPENKQGSEPATVEKAKKIFEENVS